MKWHFRNNFNGSLGPDNDTKCLCGTAASRFRDRHPDGPRLLDSGGYVRDNAATMLYLSYHIGKDFDKIEQIAKAHGYTGVSKIKRTPLHHELDDLFKDVISEHCIRGTIYKIYCCTVILMWIYVMYTHCISPGMGLLLICRVPYSSSVLSAYK